MNIVRLHLILYISQYHSSFQSCTLHFFIKKSDQGFAQMQHKPLAQEMHDIVKAKKDTNEHMDVTLEWMQRQSDFVDWPEPRFVWANCHIGKQIFVRISFVHILSL